MRLCTASETISFVKEFEEKSAQFYETLSLRHPKDKDLLQQYAKENRKYASQIQRTYYSVISDAIEGCFAFDLEAEDFAFDHMLSENVGYSEALAQAVGMEEKILAFYNKAAEQSMSLMADVPRSFKIVVKKRKDRVPTLKALA
jgi:hypothetical protein